MQTTRLRERALLLLAFLPDRFVFQNFAIALKQRDE